MHENNYVWRGAVQWVHLLGKNYTSKPINQWPEISSSKCTRKASCRKPQNAKAIGSDNNKAHFRNEIRNANNIRQATKYVYIVLCVCVCVRLFVCVREIWDDIIWLFVVFAGL